jgi:hypothetical protein
MLIDSGMSNYNSVTFRVLPYLAATDNEDDITTYYRHGKKFVLRTIQTALEQFKRKYGVEWRWGTGDSFVIDMGITSVDTRKALPIDTIKAFKRLVSTFGRLHNEIYFVAGHYQWSHLKTFVEHGYTTDCYWTDKNSGQYRKEVGTRMYWDTYKDKSYYWSYVEPNNHYNSR